MAEIEKAIEEEVITPDSEEVDVEIEGEKSEVEEVIDLTEQFYSNLAEEMS